MAELSSTDTKHNIDLVIKLSNELYPRLPLYAALSAVQAILEAGLRNAPPSKLALKYNNLFGIKGQGTGKIIDGKMQTKALMLTHEYYPGQGMIEVHDSFAVNACVEDSLKQHFLLLERPRYLKLNEAKTFEEIAQAVYDAHYATDNRYPQKLISLYKVYIKSRN